MSLQADTRPSDAEIQAGLAKAVRLYAERATEAEPTLPAFPAGRAEDRDRGHGHGHRDAQGGEPAGVRARHVAELVGEIVMDLPLSDFRRMAIEEFDTTKLLAHASRQAAERG